MQKKRRPRKRLFKGLCPGLAACARIMIPMNHFEDRTVAPTSMLHQIIYTQTYHEDSSDDARRLPLFAIMLRDLLKNPKGK